MSHQDPQTLRLLDFIKTNYNTNPEFLWTRFPNTSVLRNLGNRKWYGVIDSISASSTDFAFDQLCFSPMACSVARRVAHQKLS